LFLNGLLKLFDCFLVTRVRTPATLCDLLLQLPLQSRQLGDGSCAINNAFARWVDVAERIVPCIGVDRLGKTPVLVPEGQRVREGQWIGGLKRQRVRL
jgi:hypothetical protein